MKKAFIAAIVTLLLQVNQSYAQQLDEMNGSQTIRSGLELILLGLQGPISGVRVVKDSQESEGGKFNLREKDDLSAASFGGTVGTILGPGTVMVGSAFTIYGLGKLPIDMIRSLSELNKNDIQSLKETTNTEKQPTASLSLNDNGQVKRVTIPLEVNPHPIQLNQKLDIAPSEDIQSR